MEETLRSEIRRNQGEFQISNLRFEIRTLQTCDPVRVDGGENLKLPVQLGVDLNKLSQAQKNGPSRIIAKAR